MPTEQEKDVVREMVRELKYALYITEYDVRLVWAETDGDKGQAAESRPDCKYFTADIIIFPCYWEHSPEEQRGIITHEMCHIYTEPYKELWERAANGTIVTRFEEAIVNERLTTLIERMAMEAFGKRLEDIMSKPTRRKRK